MDFGQRVLRRFYDLRRLACERQASMASVSNSILPYSAVVLVILLDSLIGRPSAAQMLKKCDSYIEGLTPGRPAAKKSSRECKTENG